MTAKPHTPSDTLPETAPAPAKGLRQTTGAALERYLDDQMKALADDLEQFAATLVDTLDNSEPRMRQTFRSSINPLSRTIGRLAATLREQDSHRLIARGRQMISAHPLAIVGGAAAVVGGLAQLAVMATRRMEPARGH